MKINKNMQMEKIEIIDFNNYENINFVSPFPFKVTWDITHKCNLRCSHCFIIFQNNIENINVEKSKHLSIANSIASAHPFILSLAGGEPFLIPYIDEIINIFNKNDIRVIIATNGTIDNESAMNSFISSGKVSLQISIDGASEKFHDSIRGGGNFKKSINFINKYSKKIPMVIAVTLTKNVCLNLDDLFFLFKKNGVKIIKFQKFVITPSVPDKDLLPSLEELEIAKNFIMEKIIENPELIILHPFMDNNSFNNSIGLRECTITPKGNISLCGAVLDQCGTHGNIENIQLIDIWRDFTEKKISVSKVKGACLCSL